MELPPLRRLLPLLLSALLSPTAASATAVDIQPIFDLRRVVADAHSQTGRQSSLQINEDRSAGDFAPFSVMVEAAAPTDGAAPTSHASQTSTALGGNLVSASGTVGAMVLISGNPASAHAASQSVFAYQFSVDATSIYDLSGLLETSVTGDSLGEVEVALLNVTQNQDRTLFSRMADMGDDVSIAERGVLSPGMDYELFIGANAIAGGVGPGSAESLASFDVDFLIAVPEPATAALLGFALLVVAIHRRRYRAKPPILLAFYRFGP